MILPTKKKEISNTGKVLEVNKVPHFNLDDIKEAADIIKPNKAPGHGTISPEALKEVVEVAPEWILAMYNGLLERESHCGS